MLIKSCYNNYVVIKVISNNVKYIVFDIGGVLAEPLTGHWFITPNFFKIFPELEIRIEEVKSVLKDTMHFRDIRNINNEQEEKEMFYNYYKKVLEDLNYSNITEEKLQAIAEDITYNDSKFKFYDDVKRNLERLSKKYKLGILSDGWASSYRVLKNNMLDIYFNKILISSVYGCVKTDGIFFEILIKEMKIDPKDTIFVDDRELILDIAHKYNFIPIKMNRGEDELSKYPTIKILDELN